MLNLDIMKSRYHQAVDLLQAGNADEAYQAVADIGGELLREGGRIEELLEVHTSILRRAAEKIDPLTAGKMLIDTSSLLVKAVLGYSMAFCMADVVGTIREELQEKRTELEDAYRRLREEDEFRTLFSTPISHELRNPLNSIIGFSTILLNEWAGPLNDEQKQDIGLILDAGNKILQLVNDLIDVCRIESGIYSGNISPVNVADAVAEGVRRGSGNAAGRVTVVAAGEGTVRTDRDRIVQLVDRLVGSLLALVPGEIELGITAGDPAVLTATFAAPGVATEDSERVFQPFFRFGKPQGQGAGLSLYLCRIIGRDLLKGDTAAGIVEDARLRIVFTIPSLGEQG